MYSTIIYVDLYTQKTTFNRFVARGKSWETSFCSHKIAVSLWLMTYLIAKGSNEENIKYLASAPITESGI